MSLPSTLGALRASGYRPRSIREEVREHVLERVRKGEPVVSGLVGYDDTVLPELARALVIGHDVVLLGERGQGKTRILRSLVELLDDAIPVVAGSPLREDPLAPILASTRQRIAEEGDALEIEWLTRERRFSEKLATPDTTIADLIGEVDPIKVAEGRYLGDPETMHFGLVPRSHRGIFAINELPDLAERIQVGLLNALEERDIQIRGYQLSLPLDVLFVASANPEDYTSRGRLITPLKDRFGAQIHTHYPLEVDTEVAIMLQEAMLPEMPMRIPEPICRILATATHLARAHSAISQHSGVSVRASIAALETVVAAALIRAARTSEEVAIPRVLDLPAAIPAYSGKIEVDALDTDEVPRLIESLLQQASGQVFREYLGDRDPTTAIAEVSAEPLEIDPEEPLATLVARLERYPALRALADVGASPEELGCYVELALEGLVARRQLGKRRLGERLSYGQGRA
jgi:magnesium chelatase subunit I